jgi:alpha-beta hydrolase superfamily lysophospholipase
VHFGNDDRAPLLIVGAEKDNTVPTSLSKNQYEKYEKSEAQTDYIEFPGRPHLMMVAEGWEEIAGGIESWLDGVLVRSSVGARESSA